MPEGDHVYYDNNNMMMMIVTMTRLMMMTTRPIKKSVEVEAAMTWSPWRQPTALRFTSKL